MNEIIANIYNIFKYSLKQFIAEGGAYRAAALTYTSLLSIVPLMTVSFAIISAFPIFKNISSELQDFIFTHFVATSGQIIEKYLTYFVYQTKNLSAIGFFSLIFVAILMMYNLEQSLNAIWHAPERKNSIQSFLLYWAILTLTPIIISISILLSHYFYSYYWISVLIQYLKLELFFQHIFPFFMTFFLFLILYKAIPNTKVNFFHALLGSFFAAILFETAKYFFAIYVKLFPSYYLIYGALATIPIFLIWLYTIWVIVLYGAVLTKTLSYFNDNNSHEYSKNSSPIKLITPSIFSNKFSATLTQKSSQNEEVTEHIKFNNVSCFKHTKGKEMSSLFKFKKIGLMGRIQSQSSAETLKQVMEILEKYNLYYCIEEETASLFEKLTCPIFKKEELGNHCEVVIVVGGDGSILHAAHSIVDKDIPVIGINRGRLGYLTDISPLDIEFPLVEILQGRYLLENRFLLEAVIFDHKQQTCFHQIALNDVVLLPGEYAQMIEFEIFINQQLVCHQRADGQIIATPTGSTAYALSGGGPILHPSLEAIVMVPMFSHTLSTRPIVIDSQNEIEIKIAKINKTSPYVSCDGMKRFPIQPGEGLRVKRYSKMLTLLHPNSYQYFETLRTKLHWQNPL